MSLRSLVLTSSLLGMAVVFWGCDWTGGGDGGFNTSRSEIDVNISGVYQGALSGGNAVSNTSGAPIRNLVIQQSGNVLQITDSNGQAYRGTIGLPGNVFDGSGVVPSGSEIASFQVSFSGKDGVAAKDIEFTGIIHVVAVMEMFSGSTDTIEFELNDENTQFRLAGTWIEQEGVVAEVSAIASANGGGLRVLIAQDGEGAGSSN